VSVSEALLGYAWETYFCMATQKTSGSIIHCQRCHAQQNWPAGRLVAGCALLILFFSAAPIAWGQLVYSQVHSFGDTNLMAAQPSGNVVLATNGTFYGTAQSGGALGFGAIFRINPDGTGFQVIHSFNIQGSDGAYPRAALIQGADGFLYGTASAGGTNRPGSLYSGAGTLFRIALDGSGYGVFHQFAGTNDGAAPNAALLLATNGVVYGTTAQGGTNQPQGFSNGAGTLFRVNPDGTGYAVLHHFGGTNDGANPQAALVQGRDGALYGTTVSGGSNSAGTVFRIGLDGSGYTVLHRFTQLTDGSQPYSALIQTSDSMLYGTTVYGGFASGGTVFKLSPDGNVYTVLTNFGAALGNGLYIYAGVIEGSDGRLYGSASITGFGGYSGNLFSLNKDGSGLKVFHVFGNGIDSGSSPTVSLIETADGTLYGVSSRGGPASTGTLFKTKQDGSGYAVLWTFSSTGGDAATPQSGLAAARDGTFFGTTTAGGQNGHGAIYQLNPDATGYHLVFSFGSDTNGGTAPGGLLLHASDLALYGTTSSGAAPGQGNGGTIFKINPDGSGHKVLHNFGRDTNGMILPNDGNSPQSILVEGADGSLYGTTPYGGSNSLNGGIVYKLDKSGANYSILHYFGATNDGSTASGALLQGSDHLLYGTTGQGGTNSTLFGGGVLFKISTNGTGYAILHHFGATGDGLNARALIEDPDGFLYGTTNDGGTNSGISGGGTLFKIAKDGSKYQVLHHFGAGNEGTRPTSLVETNGTLYGTCTSGGTGQGGTLFQIQTDGSGYSTLYNFYVSSTADGRNPSPGLALGTNGSLFGATTSGGNSLGTVFAMLSSSNQHSNHPPIVANAIPNQVAAYNILFTYTFAANTFTDPDPGQVLTYTAMNLPQGIQFNSASRTFSGTSTNPGTYNVSVVATDNGLPPLSATNSFSLTVRPSPLAASTMVGGGLLLSFTAAPSALYTIQATDSFAPTNWHTIQVQAAGTNGLFSFVDTNAPSHSSRFYRAVGP